ncbi:MAG TPA: bacteriocin fulvocin C-related protein [Thermoanaerobaculia bacterium]
MRKIVTVLLLLGASLSVSAAGVVDLRPDRIAVQQAYDRMSDPNVNARDIYLGLTTDMQADLWVMHFEEFLAASPDLTTEQYSIVAEAIGLVSTGLLQRRHGNPEEAQRAIESLNLLTSRIRKAFTRGEGMVFGQLGYAAISTSVAALAVRGAIDEPAERGDRPPVRDMASNAPKGPIASNADCECSTVSDWCYQSPTSPYNQCYIPFPRCTRSQDGCGTLWQYGCNGFCAY